VTPIIPRANSHGFELLGAPVGEGHFPTAVIEKRIAKIHDLVISKLPTLQDSQSEYVLLRSCIGLPKFAFSLRTCDPIHHAASFRSFDGIIRDSLGIILGKTMDDHQWTQATLPVSMGGLGIRSAVAHAAASWTSSVAQTGPLVSSIANTPNTQRNSFGSLCQLNRDAGSTYINIAEVAKTTQHALSLNVDLKRKRVLEAAITDVRPRAVLNSVSLPHSGDWLNAIPSTSLGLKLHSAEFRAVAQYRLGIPLYSVAGACPTCHAHNDVFGD
jgi:hypothetical protein